jgi:predicted TIM-barrel fold metal-dependent hydrolase
MITEWNKIYWGTDFPFTSVKDSIDGLRNINRQVEGTNLPRVSQSTIEGIIHSNPLEHWWHGGYPG